MQNARLPYETHKAAGRAKVKVVQTPTGWVEQTFLTPRGLDRLADRLGANMLPLV